MNKNNTNKQNIGLNKVAKTSIIVGSVAILALAVTLPIVLIKKGYSNNIVISGPNYCYLNEEIDVNNIDVYESDGKNLTKLNSSEFSISPKKFGNKFDGVQMVTVTTKKGNKNQFPVKMLESYEVNEQAFKNFPKELAYGNKVLEYSDKGVDAYPGHRKDRDFIETVTKYGNRELSYVHSHSKSSDGEEYNDYKCVGGETVFDEKTGKNKVYSLHACLDKNTKKIVNMLDYRLPNGNTTEFDDTPCIQGRVDSFSTINFNNLVLKDDKTYEYNYSNEYLGALTEYSIKYTFDNGKIQKITGKESNYNPDSSYTIDEFSQVIKRVETTDPFINVQKLNYQYLATNLEGNKFETTVNAGSKDSISFNITFFEDYDSVNKKYINEVKEGYFVDYLTKDLLKINNQTNVNASFDESKKLTINITPKDTEEGFVTGKEYKFYIMFNGDKENLSDNMFLYYINGWDLRKGIEFTINVK